MNPKPSYFVTNVEIASLFRSVAAALELTPGDNRFKIIAYERAADSIEHASSEMKDLWDDHQLDSVSGVGASITGYLHELFTTGQVEHFQKILKKFPPALFELLQIPGVGPKTAQKLCKALGISKAHGAIQKLQTAAKKGHVAKIDGFGEDSQTEILTGIKEYLGRSKRMLLPQALSLSQDLIDWLKKDPAVIKVHALGSLRRSAATVGDIDISVATNEPKKVIAHFCAYPKKIRVLEAGEHTASLILPGECQIDLMVQRPQSYGSLLQHFTGSKHHNIALRELALKKGLSLSEYGIKTKSGLKEFATEEDFYAFLGLEYIPPELREDRGEILAAQNHELPDLVNLSDIKGDLHVHSNINVEPGHDLGKSSPEVLSEEAKKLKYEYLGLTEHNPSVSQHTVGKITEIIKLKTNIVHECNQIYESKHENYPYLLNGLEVDIQPDGKRSLPDACLELLDYACVSIHSSFRQSRKIMTARVIRGLDHPKVKFLAHPTARLLQEREGIDLDWEVLFDFCLKNHKWLEIDAWPNRLDLPDALVKTAITSGVGIVINSDSHDSSHLQYLEYGVKVARRGWATKTNVVNTLSFDKLVKMIGYERR